MINENKTKEIILSILNVLGFSKDIDKNTLALYLYFLDMYYYYKNNQKFFLGLKYVKNNSGLIVDGLDEILEEMKNDKEIEEQIIYPQSIGYETLNRMKNDKDLSEQLISLQIIKYVPLTYPMLSEFPEEKKIYLGGGLEILRIYTFDKMLRSYIEGIPYHMAKDGEVILYKNVVNLKGFYSHDKTEKTEI